MSKSNQWHIFLLGALKSSFNSNCLFENIKSSLTVADKDCVEFTGFCKKEFRNIAKFLMLV